MTDPETTAQMPAPRQRKPVQRVNPDQVGDIIDRFRAGELVGAIAEEVGVTRSVVMYHLKAAGFGFSQQQRLRADVDPICRQLRRIREGLGLSLARVEDLTDRRWRSVVIGSYERGDRQPTVRAVRELLNWYGYTLTITKATPPPTE